jgi:hypothetical protein
MKTRQSWTQWLSVFVLVAALAGFVAVGPVAAGHCPSPAPLAVRESSWARFYQYSLASSGEATPAEIVNGKAERTALICLDGDSQARFETYLVGQGLAPVKREMNSLERFNMYLFGLGPE